MQRNHKHAKRHQKYVANILLCKKTKLQLLSNPNQIILHDEYKLKVLCRELRILS